MDMQKNSKNNSSRIVLVIGGGIGGLFSAWKLLKKGFQVVVLERQNHLGGLSASIPFNGFKMDIGPHFVIAPKNAELTEEIKELMSEEIISIQDIHKWYRVFFKNSVLEEYPPLYEMIFKNGVKSFLQSFFSYATSKIKYSCVKSNFKSAKEYIVCNYGNYLYKNWFKPYLDFYYGKNEHPITTVQEKFPPLKFGEVFHKIRKRTKEEETENYTSPVNYWYFKQGMGSLVNTLTKNIKNLGGKILLSADIKNIEHEKESKEISIVKDGTETKLYADIILYTTPSNVTKAWFENYVKIDDSPKNSSNGILIFLFVDHPRIVDWWLITNYDPGFSFFRITQQNYLSDYVSPFGKSLLCVEINTKDKEYLWNLPEDELIKKIKDDLKRMEIFDIKKIEDYKIFKFKNIYHGAESNGNLVSEKISNVISSLKNEFMVGVEIDPGILVTKRIEDAGNTEKVNISLGGVYMTLEQSKRVVEEIASQSKKS